MRSRRAQSALVAAAVVCTTLTGAPMAARADEQALVTNPVNYVDTLTGTGTGGETVGEINNFPGAAVPFGMVQYSPDTTDTYAGYDHGNERSTGFSMTHASVGCKAFGDISMLPTTTPIGSEPWNDWERIAHDDTELGVPGYYRVRFPETGVTAELTATTRTGVGRFTYPFPSIPGTRILTVNTPLFDRAQISLPGGQSIRIFAPGASGRNGLKYLNGLSINGRATDKTFLPESIIRTGGDLAFWLSATPNMVWGTAESSAPPSFSAEQLAHDR